MNYKTYLIKDKLTFKPLEENMVNFGANPLNHFQDYQLINSQFNFIDEFSGSIAIDTNIKNVSLVLLEEIDNNNVSNFKFYVIDKILKITSQVIVYHLNLDLLLTYANQIIKQNLKLDLNQFHYNYKNDLNFIRKFAPTFNTIGDRIYYSKPSSNNKNSDYVRTQLNRQKNTFEFDAKNNTFNVGLLDINNNTSFKSNYMDYDNNVINSSGSVYGVFKFILNGLQYIMGIPLISSGYLKVGGLNTNGLEEFTTTNGNNTKTYRITNINQILDLAIRYMPNNFIGYYVGPNYLSNRNQIGNYTFVLKNTDPFGPRNETTWYMNAIVFNVYGRSYNATNYFNIKPFNIEDSYAYNELTHQAYLKYVDFDYENNLTKASDMILTFNNGFKLISLDLPPNNGQIVLNYGGGIIPQIADYAKDLLENKRAWSMGLYTNKVNSLFSLANTSIQGGFNTSLSRFAINTAINSISTGASYIKNNIINNATLNYNNLSANLKNNGLIDIDFDITTRINFYNNNSIFYWSYNSDFKFCYVIPSNEEFNMIVDNINLFGVLKTANMNISQLLNGISLFSFAKCEGNIIRNELYKLTNISLDSINKLIAKFVNGVRIWKAIPTNNWNPKDNKLI